MEKHTIVIASESFYPVISGVSVMTERLAHYLAEQGHTVVVITPSRNRSAYTERRRGYTIERIPSWPNPFRKGLRFTIFPKKAVAAVLDKVRPDILHIHDPALTSQAVADYGREHKLPVVVTHHFMFDFVLAYFSGLKPLHPQFCTILEHSLRTLYNTCDLVTVPSETMRRTVQEMHLTVPVRVISNGVDTKRFKKQVSVLSLRKKYGLSRKPTILLVGRMDPEKEVDTLIRALAVLHKRGRPFRALLVGMGNSKEEWQELARELGVHKALIWIDRVDNTSRQLQQLYQASDIFCIPSPIETESIVTMEAMAAGLPIIAAKRGALVELVEDQSNGYLLEPGDHEKWAEHIEKLLSDSEMRKTMGKMSQEKIADRDIRYSLAEFEALYEELLAENSRPIRALRRGSEAAAA